MTTVKGMIENIHKQLNKLSENINEKIQNGDYPNVKYTCVLREGIPEEEILYYIRQEKPLIVVMECRGEHQKDLDLIGSVTAEVIERVVHLCMQFQRMHRRNLLRIFIRLLCLPVSTSVT